MQRFTHADLSHPGFAWGVSGQLLPHWPQFLGSLLVSAQPVGQETSGAVQDADPSPEEGESPAPPSVEGMETVSVPQADAARATRTAKTRAVATAELRIDPPPARCPPRTASS